VAGAGAGRSAGASAASRLALPLLLAVFFASGFAALLYQVVWQRMLALFSGADVFSVTIVVSAFMAGLGVGNLAGGHLADRLSRRACLLLFAVAELAVGLFALQSKWLYYDVLYTRLGAAALSAPVLAAVLFAAVVWPTFFMGVSLPLLARGLTSAIAAAARTVGSLYGWNTLGAATGALVTTWVFLRRFDFETCLLIGAALNLGCAAAVLPLRGMLAGEAAPEPAPAPAPEPARAPLFGVRGWLLIYALSGATALSLEIAWFRMLGVMLKSTSFTFGTLLAIYLLGVGGGSLVGSRLAPRLAGDPAARFLALQAGIPAYAALSIAALVAALGGEAGLASLRAFFAGTEPLRVGLASLHLSANPLGVWSSASPAAAEARLLFVLYALLPLLLIGPPTFLMGLSFPYLQRAVQTDARFLGRRVGWLQTANIAGSLTGSLLTGFVLLPRLGTAGTFRVLAALALVFVALRLRAARARRWPVSLAVGAAVVAALLVVPSSQVFWSRLHGARPGHVLQAEDAAGLSLIRRTGPAEHTVMAGGLGLSEFPYGTYGGVHTLLGALPVLLHPAPQRVAVIGLGSGDTSYAAGARPESREVVTIEIIGSQLEVLRAFHASRPQPGLAALFSEPRFRTVVDDGRTHVRRDAERYDVIEADALRPNSAYSGNLYSLEYFALLRERLAPGGLAVSWLPTERVRATFLRSFPHVLIVNEIGVGSETPIPFEREALLARARQPEVQGHFARVGIDLERLLRDLLAKGPVQQFGPEHDRAAYTDVNRDLFAKDEFLIGVGRW
jgi:predicted membrane-bound spermidine synthase